MSQNIPGWEGHRGVSGGNSRVKRPPHSMFSATLGLLMMKGWGIVQAKN